MFPATGRRGVSLPFADRCAPLCPDAGAFRELFAAACTHGRQRRWRHLEIRGARELCGDVPAAVRYWGHLIDIAAGEHDLLQRFDGSVRRAIKKAERRGLSMEITNSLEALRDFYRLHCRTRRRLAHD